MLSVALREGSLQAANYFIAQNYLEALKAFATSPNQKTLILPIEAAATLGSLAGIAELAREAMAGRPSAGAPTRAPAALGPARHMSLTFWHWFALGGGLLLLEMLTPGVVFLWLALAAGLAGILLLLAPGLSWQMQVLSFAVAAVVTVGLSFRWRRRMPVAGGDPGLNRRALAYVGT